MAVAVGNRGAGAAGLAWLKGEAGSLAGPIAKAFTAESKAQLCRLADMRDGDLLLMVADQSKVVHETLGRLRRELAAGDGDSLNAFDITARIPCLPASSTLTQRLHARASR